jgi:plastocyanin
MHQPVTRPRRRSLLVGSLALAAALTLASGVALAADQAVTIADFAFSPQTVTVTVGDTVTWTNSDQIAHTATAGDGSWDTGDIAQGQSAAITFSTAGTFAYICTPHPTMTGTVVVEAAAGGGGGGGGGGAAPTIPPTDAASLAGPEAAPDPLPGVLGLLAVVALTSLALRRRPAAQRD